jgi:hypothetical protein
MIYHQDELELGECVCVVLRGGEIATGIVTNLDHGGRVQIRTGDVTKDYRREELRRVEEVDDKTEGLEQAYLHIGDVISISGKGCIASEGILDNKCLASGEPRPFDSCLFQIAIKNRVAGALDLEEYETNTAAEINDRGSGAGDQMLSTLRRVKQNEAELNAILQIEQAGEPIHFGMVIQLRHINSGKWLTANTGAVAAIERESLECSLSDETSKRCWFTVMPSSSLRSEGMKVENDCDLYLGEGENGYLHVSVQPVTKEGAQESTQVEFEVNISMNPTVWKFQLYTAHHTEDGRSCRITCGDVVKLYDPMLDGYLRALGRRERESLDEIEKDCLVVSSQTDNQSSSMWVLERRAIAQGGIIDHGNDLCLRHLASNKFLCLSSSAGRKAGELTASLVADRMVDGTNITMQPMSKIDLKDSIVREEDQIMLQSGGRWLGHDASTQETSFGQDDMWNRAKATTRTSAACLILRKADVTMCRETRALRASATVLETFMNVVTASIRSDGGVAATSTSTLVPDLLKAIELCDQLSRYATGENVAAESEPTQGELETGRERQEAGAKKPTAMSSTAKLTKLRKASNAINVRKKSDLAERRKELARREITRADVLISLQSTPQKHSDLLNKWQNNNPLLPQANVDKARQDLAREASLLDLVLDALEVLTELSEIVVSRTESSCSERATCAIELLIERCFSVIYYYSLKNYKNQVFVGERFSVLSWYLDKSDGAMSTVAELLSNQDVLEDMITVAEVEQFVGMLANAESTESSCRFYKLLTAICSCRGEGIESNQTLVASILFHRYTALIYKLHDNGGRLEVAPAAKDLLLEFKDFDLDGDGNISLEELRIGMRRSGADVSDDEIARTFSLYDVNTDGDIAYEEFVRGSPPRVFLENLYAKPAHVNLFASQLSLFAAMCHDRNYIVISAMQERFSYATLLRAIEQSPLPLRSAFLQLVTNVYVDTKPQEHFSNQLAFKWTKIDSSLPKPKVVSGSTPGPKSRAFGKSTTGLVTAQVVDSHFQELKEMISSELTNSKKASEKKEFQLEIMKLLKMLISFKFYHTIDDLRSITVPLMAILNQLKISKQVQPSTAGRAHLDRQVVPEDENGTAAMVRPKKGVTDRLSKQRAKVLALLDSIPTMGFILGLVFYSILASQVQGDDLMRDIIVFVIFAVEMFVRMWAVNDRRAYLADPYAVMDVVVVLLDVFTFAAESILGAAGGFTKALRAVRMVRLVRLVRAARFAKAVYALGNRRVVHGWKAPNRYANTSRDNLATMRQVAMGLQTVLLMRNTWGLSLFVERIRRWSTGQEQESILEVFEGVVRQSDTLRLGNPSNKVMDVLTDLCMYEDMELVHEALRLMVLHSQPYKLMMGELHEVQLMVTEEEEVLLDKLKDNFYKLQILIESFEIWSGLEDKRSIYKSEMTMDILDDLTDACRLPTDKLLMSRGSFVANTDTQKLMRCLGGFEVMMAAVACFSHDESEFDEEDLGLKDGKTDSISRCLGKTFELLAWFISDNKEHQVLVYQHLDVFERLAASQSGATLVMVEIFRDNFELLKRVPPYLITDTIKFIFGNGRKSQYLELLDVLTHIGNFGIRKNQILIVNELTKPDYQSRVLFLPEGPGTPAYIERLELMRQVHGKGRCSPPPDGLDGIAEEVLMEEGADPNRDSRQAGYGISDDDHLPPELQYHTKLLITLSGCAAGEINIVEAKVQSLCEYENVIHGLLDSNTIIEVKIALGRFLFDVVIDTEIKLDSLCDNELMWQYIRSWPEAITHATGALGSLRQARAKSELLGLMSYHRRALVCYCFEAIVPSIDFFFLNYFDEERLPWKRDQVVTLLENLATSLSTLHRASAGLLLPEHDFMLQSAFGRLQNLGKLSDKLAQLHVLGIAKTAYVQDMTTKTAMRDRRKRFSIVPIDTRMIEKASFGTTGANTGGKENTLSGYLNTVALNNSMSMDDGHNVRSNFKKVVQLITAEPEVAQMLDVQNTELITYLKRLPRMGDAGRGLDVRFEPLLERLVAHVHSCIKGDCGYAGTSRQTSDMSKENDETALFLVELFQQMIEFEWGFTISKRDDEGDKRSDEKASSLQDAFDAAGVTALCLQLVSSNISPQLMLAAVRLLVALLYREGGNKIVQATISKTLSKVNTDTKGCAHSQNFLMAMRNSLQAVTLWHVTDAPELPATKEDKEPEEHGLMIVTRLLQLMCEGHYEPNQDLMRGDGKSQFNLLVLFVEHIRELEKIHTRVATHSMTAVLGTTLEVVQGPCFGNQMYLVMESEVLEILNRLVRRKINAGTDQVTEDEDELKKTVILIFKALLEGQGKPSIIYDRVLSVLHLEVLQLLAMPRSEGGSKLNDMQIQTTVLLQMLTDYQPSLQESLQLHLPKDQVVSVEVVWKKELIHKFFPVPEKLRFLSKQARGNVVEHVERASAELKLLDFINRCMDLHVEMQHQENLDELGLQWLFSRKHQTASTWIAFGLACLVNLIIFTYYEYPNESSEKPEIQEESVRDALFVLNVLQVVFAVFTLVFFVVVRAPVIFKLNYERRERGLALSLLATLSDGLTIYYFLYVVVCLLVINVNFIFASILLLDIVIKNSTTRDVLRAVYKPAKQLAATAVLTFFVMYIFAFVLFVEFRDDFQDGVNDGLCDTLGRCTLVTGNFGLRRTGGVGEQLGMTRDDLSSRVFVDWLYYIVVLVILLNVVFGIVIDTFGEIRTAKMDRTTATQNFCFVCDLEKYKFNELAGSIQGFKRHIEAEHNMWDYLAFMIFLWEQDQDDDDGLELYVRHLLHERDLSWFPMSTSMSVRSQYGNQKKGEDEIKYQIEKLASAVDVKFGEIKSAASEVADSIAAIGRVVGHKSTRK